MEGHYSPEMLQQGQMMFQGMPGMSGPGQMPQMPFGNMEQLQNQVAQVPMGNQAQGHPHPNYAMQGHMGMQGMAQGMPQQMQGMAQGMGQGMQGMPQGMPQGMSPGMSADGSMVPFQMGGDQQAAQAAQHGAQMMPHAGGAGGGCGCQGNPCGACPTATAQGACGGNCGGYVFQPMQNMMMPQNMMAGQMPGVAGQASGQQQQAQQQQAQQQQQQFHPNMQVFMVPGGPGGQMQPGMAGMQMPGQMAMHGMQGQMPHMPGHMPDGHGNPGAVPPDQGHGHGEGPGDGDAKGGPGRMAAGRRNTQPKQGGASWGGASRSGRPDMRGPDSEVPAVPGEQGKGAGNQPSPPNPDGQKGMRKPKNPWADIQDSGGLDQEMAQMWAIGQMPAMDNQQKSGFKGKSGKKEGKNEGKTDGKTDDSGGKGDMKNAAQHKWVEKNNNNAGKGQKGMRQDQWQPTLGKESPKLQEAVPMSPMPMPGKGKAPQMYNQSATPPQAAAKKKGRRDLPSKDPKMDDWLSARFNGHVPPTPTGSMGGDDSEWTGEGGYDGDRPKRKGGKGGGGKGGGGKGDRKGGNGNGGKGKAKGGGRGGNGGNYWGA